MTENEISKLVVDLCFKIHKQYGPGLFESVYEEIMCYELIKTGINFTRQQGISLIHEETEWKSVLEQTLLLKIKS